MYSILLKKNQNDKYPYPVNDAIEAYINKYGKNDVMLVIPGYQSTTKPRIDTFCNELRRIAPKNDIYFSYGMNGGNTEKYTKKTIHDVHYAVQPQVLNFQKDHSKCIVFVDMNSINNFDNILDNNLFIKAILLGSSNMSCATYVDSPTLKGELDIFLLNEKVFNDNSTGGILEFKRSIIGNQENSDPLNYLVTKTIDRKDDNESFNHYINDFLNNDN